jgi:hypothetical protein
VKMNSVGYRLQKRSESSQCFPPTTATRLGLLHTAVPIYALGPLIFIKMTLQALTRLPFQSIVESHAVFSNVRALPMTRPTRSDEEEALRRSRTHCGEYDEIEFFLQIATRPRGVTLTIG